MKLTKSQLEQIIKEELQKILNEQAAPGAVDTRALTYKWKWCKPKTAAHVARPAIGARAAQPETTEAGPFGLQEPRSVGMAFPQFGDPVGSWLSGDEPWEHEGPQRMEIKYGLEWFRNFDAAGQQQIYDKYLSWGNTHARTTRVAPERCGCFPDLERKGKRHEACDTFNNWLWNYEVPPEYKQDPTGGKRPLGADPPPRGERVVPQSLYRALKEELDAFFQEDSVYSRDDFTDDCKTSCCVDTENCTTGEEACVESCVDARIKAAKKGS